MMGLESWSSSPFHNIQFADIYPGSVERTCIDQDFRIYRHKSYINLLKIKHVLLGQNIAVWHLGCCEAHEFSLAQFVVSFSSSLKQKSLLISSDIKL